MADALPESAQSASATDAPRGVSSIAGPVMPELLRDERLHEIFAATADRMPEKTVLRCGGMRMTYGELRRRSSRVARHLRALGVGRGSPVVIWLPRGVEMYEAFLGVLEAGGCHVALDPDFPPERVLHAAEDCGAKAFITTEEMAGRLAAHPPQCTVVRMDEDQGEIAAQSAEPVPRADSGVSGGDAAYIIYTSGSTGRPKGVAISHAAICHFVRSEGSVLGLTEHDVVFQGFSLSFDMSLEEIWTAFAAGATLVVGTRELMHAAGELATVLAREGVTAWSCVPTLLAMQEGALPTLRILNLGGEACPPDLVRRWAAPGRRILNTYGPTETAITATWAEVGPDHPVTIGRPLPNYGVHILGEDQSPVPLGETGELCVSGPGLAIGYVNRDDLTREKFFLHPALGRLYRSGDLARINADGDIEFLGRIDTQVKIRGYRVELSEIESVLLEDSAVRQAVAGLWKDAQGGEVLTAWLVMRDGASPDEPSLRTRLRARLPAYMVPAIFEVIERMPVLPNGKTDRRSLPAPTHRAEPTDRAVVRPETITERILHGVWTELFAPVPVSCEDDFFLDLGGHSLKAAALVSNLRRNASMRHISMADIYSYPTVRTLAAWLDATAAQAVADDTDAEPFAHVGGARQFWCGVAQAASLPIIYTFFSLPLLIPYLAYAWMTQNEYDRVLSVLTGVALFIAIIPASLLVAIAIKWLVLGRERPGRHPLWGTYYFRWWLVNRILGAIPAQYLTGSPLAALYFRLLGARIGENVHLGTDALSCPGQIEIGDDSCISDASALMCARVERGWLKIAPIRIGAGCVVGASSVISGGAVMEDRARLGELSLLPEGARIPRGEIWNGSPARKTGTVETPAPPRPSLSRRAVFGAIFAVLAIVFPVFLIAPIFPGMALMTELDQRTEGYSFLLLSPVLAFSFIVCMCLQIAAAKWILVGRIRPGRHPLLGSFYVRWWLMDKFMQLSLDIVHPLYATVYLNPWYRLLGVKIGRRAEVSTASSISPDLVELGDECFIADAVILGVPRIADGEIVLDRTRAGRRAFVGNSALLPSGTDIGDDVLIGCLSVPPADPADALRVNSSWFGTPAVFLPQRQRAQQFDEGSTFRPSRRLLVQRYLIEAVRVLLPMTCFVLFNSALMSVIVDWDENVDMGLPEIFLRFPLLYMALAALAFAFVIALKWLVIGRYRPVEKPLWNNYVWRSELVTATYEQLAVPLVLDHLRGTPFLPWCWRLLGAKFGSRVHADTTDITEFDVVSVGDDASLDSDCGLQTHLFEDRVMKISTVDVGARCAVGAIAIALYDSRMEDDSKLDDLSMLMKGETLPAGTAWRGSPARKI